MRFFFPIVILLLFFFADIYIFQAFKVAFKEGSGILKRTVSIFYWLVCFTVYFGIVAFILSTTQGFELPKALKTSFSVLFFGYFFFKLFAFPLLLIDDLWRGGKYLGNLFSPNNEFSLSRNRFLSSASVILGAIPFLAVIQGSIRNVHNYKIRKIAHRVKDLPNALNGLKIIQISDIHAGSLIRKKPIQEIVTQINDLAPDLIFFTGDLVNYEHSEILPFQEIFAQLKAKYGVYSVKGNHDYGGYVRTAGFDMEQNRRLFEEAHKNMGWDLLLNEHRQININGENVAVIGVENWSAGGFGKLGDLAKAHRGCEDCSLKLLLSHDPSHWRAETVKGFRDIDITFSGHTHGMQFGIDMKKFKWSPVQYVYRDWAGLYTEGDQALYVNRGFGVLGYYGRVGVKPEITVMQLESA